MAHFAPSSNVDCWFNIENVVKTRHTCTTWNLMRWNGKSFPASPSECAFVHLCVVFQLMRPANILFLLSLLLHSYISTISWCHRSHIRHIYTWLFLQIYDKRYVIVLMKCEAGVQMPVLKEKLDKSRSLLIAVKSEARHFLRNQHSAGKSSAQHRLIKLNGTHVKKVSNAKEITKFVKMRLLFHAKHGVWFESMFPQTIVNFFLL